MTKKYNKTSIHRILCFLLLLPILFAVGCSSKNQEPVSQTEMFFDTVVTITLYGDDAKYLEDCFNICEQYEKKFSKSIEDSEIAAINRNSANGMYTPVSEETLELICMGIRYGDLSGGKFDITIGALTKLWNFGDIIRCPHDDDGEDEEITRARNTVDYRQISIRGNEVLLQNKEALLDLGGIAKGYIADQIKAYLVEQHVKSAVINLGGNVMTIGKRPDGHAYRIGIKEPFSDDGEIIAVLQVKDQTVVTSGSYERYALLDGEILHHILDPETGYPSGSDLDSVTIITGSSADADALSTTVFLLGSSKGMELVESLEDVEAILIDHRMNLQLSSGLKQTDHLIKMKEK